jgi:hypothetical protein
VNTNLLAHAATLSDEALLRRHQDLARQTRESTAELIAHLAELARRKAHRSEGEGSLFMYCVRFLHLSEAATCNRLAAAYAARRFPVILDLLADGSVNLTTIRILAPHLTAENHRAVLAEATGKRKGDVKKIRARLSPQPDVPASVRKAPTPRAAAPDTAPPTSPSATPHTPGCPPAVAPPEAPSPVPAPHFLSAPPSKQSVEPVAPSRYHVHLTVGEDTHRKLRRLQDLKRREVPGGDIDVFFDRGLDLQLAEAEKQAYCATTRPQPPPGGPRASRDPSAHVKRIVWARDGGRCAFIGRKGRCSEQSFLEFHHVDPHILGGEPTEKNIELRCRAHNVYEAELLFGPFEPSLVREAVPVYG